jgi:threonine synthase
VAAGDAIDVCVPTGNFGNILAAYYAKEMGTPIDKLICASNENCILSDFINTGVYDLNGRSLVSTPSPSMDILIPINLERQLFEIFGRDGNRVKEIFNELASSGKFELDADCFAHVRELFESDYATNDESLQTIRMVYESHGYLMDPHTAVAWKVVEKLRGEGGGAARVGGGGASASGGADENGTSEKPVLIVSTANWAKFGKDVYRALNNIAADEELPNEAASLSGTELNTLIAENANKAGANAGAQAQAQTREPVTIPENLANLDKLEHRHNKTCPANAKGVEQSITTWLA